MLVFVFISCNPELKLPSGVMVENPPKQINLIKPKTWNYKEYNFTAHAKFELKAKVLGKEKYRIDRESDLAPYDLALGWQLMSDQEIVDNFEITQNNRWFFWKSNNTKLSKREVELSTANMHIIPANDKITNKLSEVREGEIIYLKGYLVSVTSRDGWRWNTSLTRTDIGNGACEIIWTEKLLRIK